MKVRKQRRCTCRLDAQPSLLKRVLVLNRETGQRSYGYFQEYFTAVVAHVFSESLYRDMTRPGFARRLFDPNWRDAYVPYVAKPFVFEKPDPTSQEIPISVAKTFINAAFE